MYSLWIPESGFTPESAVWIHSGVCSLESLRSLEVGVCQSGVTPEFGVTPESVVLHSLRLSGVHPGSAVWSLSGACSRWSYGVWSLESLRRSGVWSLQSFRVCILDVTPEFVRITPESGVCIHSGALKSGVWSLDSGCHSGVVWIHSGVWSSGVTPESVVTPEFVVWSYSGVWSLESLRRL